ncbi:MAG: hypothetical protein ACOC1E_03200 [Marinilabiliaceae bacterium]
MFLIGISGSLLPYLLVGGIVLVFSFKASEHFMDNDGDENQVLASKHILFINDSSDSVPQSNFYFSSSVLKSGSSGLENDQNKETQPALYATGPPFFVSLNVRKTGLVDSVSGSFSSGFLFSGLSPPASVFS